MLELLLGLKGKMEEMTEGFLVGWKGEGFSPLSFGCRPFLHLWRVAQGVLIQEDPKSLYQGLMVSDA